MRYILVVIALLMCYTSKSEAAIVRVNGHRQNFVRNQNFRFFRQNLIFGQPQNLIFGQPQNLIFGQPQNILVGNQYRRQNLVLNYVQPQYLQPQNIQVMPPADNCQQPQNIQVAPQGCGTQALILRRH